MEYVTKRVTLHVKDKIPSMLLNLKVHSLIAKNSTMDLIRTQEESSPQSHTHSFNISLNYYFTVSV
jgi:hypothetical protein